MLYQLVWLTCLVASMATESAADECAICKEEFMAGDKRADQMNPRKFVWQCSHPHNLKLHKECMKKQMKIFNECPICRTPLKDVRIFKRFRKKSERADAVESERRKAERRRQRQERAAGHEEHMEAIRQSLPPYGMMPEPFEMENFPFRV